ncbi:hypothetical protein [Nostoc sp. MS1]|uniref:hypothetical protein n=1 Tax=Nostoc sp. MS1 TaxID=2764711 RepID=UPI001CC65B91|nr:hypothetical protein [Nostoc sp. MS1]BCL35462.1 hypothetical protein NSMS1_19090 [Nostoc sp. MS1]
MYLLIFTHFGFFTLFYLNDNFYDPQLNGINWAVIKTKYRPHVERSKSGKEVEILFNQMLSELKTSHTHYYTQDEPAYYQLLGIFYANAKSTDLPKRLREIFPKGKFEYTGIGLFTKDINGKTFVRSILEDV